MIPASIGVETHARNTVWWFDSDVCVPFQQTTLHSLEPVEFRFDMRFAASRTVGTKSQIHSIGFSLIVSFRSRCMTGGTYQLDNQRRDAQVYEMTFQHIKRSSANNE